MFMARSQKSVKSKSRQKKVKHAIVSIHNSEAQRNEMKKLMQAMFEKWKNLK